MSSYSSTDHLLSIIAASLETRRLAITGNLHTLPAVTTATNENYLLIQWRRQDLLQGGAKLEIRSWGTHGELHGRPGAEAARFVTNAVLDRVVSC